MIDISSETLESLHELPKTQLVVLCQQRRLPYSGNKMELARRLLHHEITSHDPGDVMGDIFKCWFLEPVCTESMKVGSQNETKVLAALPREFNNLVSEWALSSKSQITFQWVDAIDVGLLCLKNARYIGTSVDKLALIRCIEVPPEVHTSLSSVNISWEHFPLQS